MSLKPDLQQNSLRVMKSSKLWKFYNCIYQDGVIDFLKSKDGYTLAL